MLITSQAFSCLSTQRQIMKKKIHEKHIFTKDEKFLKTNACV